MNKLFGFCCLFLMVAVSIVFFACDNNDDEESGINGPQWSSIYGTWILSNEEGTENGEYYSHPYKWTWYFRFNPDDTWTSYWENEGKWELRGRGNLSIDAANGIIEFDYIYQLLELTNKTLKVKETYQNGDYQTKTFTKVADSLLDDVIENEITIKL